MVISNVGESGEHYSGEDKRLHSPTFELEIKEYHENQRVDVMNSVLWDYFFSLQSPFKNQFVNIKTYYLFGFLPIFSIEEK